MKDNYYQTKINISPAVAELLAAFKREDETEARNKRRRNEASLQAMFDETGWEPTDSHVHTNSQALNRPWDKIREQQGCFIHALETKDYGEFLIVKAISYTKYESALECLPPPRKGIMPASDKYHVMRYGEILEHKFKVPVSSLTYDTRHFRAQLLNYTEGVNDGNDLNDTRAEIII